MEMYAEDWGGRSYFLLGDAGLINIEQFSNHGNTEVSKLTCCYKENLLFPFARMFSS